MLFVDHAQITVKAGDGGRGCLSFAQPPYTRNPYPDGGDGGEGGDVIVEADSNIATLLDFQFRHEFAAQRGGHAGSNKKTGKRGDVCIIRVPVGTVVHDASTEKLLRDLTRHGQRLIVARGGCGGLGTAIQAARRRRSPGGRFRTIGQAERLASEAGPGEERVLALELKLIADCGIVGLPNAGKSSLLARISSARPKVAAYPFTTRYPVLGVVNADSRGSFVACDIPGLIEGAHTGRGLGIQFLRHIERTRLLVHVIDMASLDGRDPHAAFKQLGEELSAYSQVLSERPQIIVANKMDLPEAKAKLETFRSAVGKNVIPISCATGKGVPALLKMIWEALHLAGA